MSTSEPPAPEARVSTCNGAFSACAPAPLYLLTANDVGLPIASIRAAAAATTTGCGHGSAAHSCGRAGDSASVPASTGRGSRYSRAPPPPKPLPLAVAGVMTGIAAAGRGAGVRIHQVLAQPRRQSAGEGCACVRVPAITYARFATGIAPETGTASFDATDTPSSSAIAARAAPMGTCVSYSGLPACAISPLRSPSLTCSLAQGADDDVAPQARKPRSRHPVPTICVRSLRAAHMSRLCAAARVMQSHMGCADWMALCAAPNTRHLRSRLTLVVPVLQRIMDGMLPLGAGALPALRPILRAVTPPSSDPRTRAGWDAIIAAVTGAAGLSHAVVFDDDWRGVAWNSAWQGTPLDTRSTLIALAAYACDRLASDDSVLSPTKSTDSSLSVLSPSSPPSASGPPSYFVLGTPVDEGTAAPDGSRDEFRSAAFRAFFGVRESTKSEVCSSVRFSVPVDVVVVPCTFGENTVSVGAAQLGSTRTIVRWIMGLRPAAERAAEVRDALTSLISMAEGAILAAFRDAPSASALALHAALLHSAPLDAASPFGAAWSRARALQWRYFQQRVRTTVRANAMWEAASSLTLHNVATAPCSGTCAHATECVTHASSARWNTAQALSALNCVVVPEDAHGRDCEMALAAFAFGWRNCPGGTALLHWPAVLQHNRAFQGISASQTSQTRHVIVAASAELRTHLAVAFSFPRTYGWGAWDASRTIAPGPFTSAVDRALRLNGHAAASVRLAPEENGGYWYSASCAGLPAELQKAHTPPQPLVHVAMMLWQAANAVLSSSLINTHGGPPAQGFQSDTAAERRLDGSRR